MLKERQTEMPWVINLELTNACNLECVFCDHRVLKRKMQIKEMEEDLLKKTLLDVKREVLSGKIHELGLVGLGEPTLDRRLAAHLRIIDNFADIFERISFNTNLVDLQKKQAEILSASKINVYTFSVNASNNEMYMAMMGKDYFERVIKNLNFFLKLLKKNSQAIKVGIQVLESDKNDIEELKQRISDIAGLQVQFFYRWVYSKPVIRKSTELIKLYTPPKIRYPCWDIYTRVYIDVNGNLYPCTIGNDCYRQESKLCLGNVYNDFFFTFFYNEEIQMARELFETGQFPFSECSICNRWAIIPNNFKWDKVEQRWRKKDKPLREFGLKG